MGFKKVSARFVKQCAAIWLRALLCTQMNRTFLFVIGFPCGRPLSEQGAWLAAPLSESCQSHQVPFENWVGLNAILQAFQVFLQFKRCSLWQGIDNPILLSRGRNHSFSPQIGQMFRDLNLILTKNVLKVADT